MFAQPETGGLLTRSAKHREILLASKLSQVYQALKVTPKRDRRNVYPVGSWLDC